MLPNNEEQELRWLRQVLDHDDSDAFGRLVQLHQSPIRRFLARLAGDQTKAEDLAQETFLRAYRYIGSFRGEGRFQSWLFKIAYQEFLKDLRRKRDTFSLHAIPDSAMVDLAPGSSSATMDLEKALLLLAMDERAVLVLHYQYGCSHGEIAEVISLPLGTVKSKINRAKQKLQRFLTETAGKER